MEILVIALMVCIAIEFILLYLWKRREIENMSEEEYKSSNVWFD